MLKRLALASAGLLAAVPAAVPAAAQAGSGTTCQLTGTMQEQGPLNFQSQRLAGNNEIDSLTHPILLQGAVSGTGFDQERSWGSGVTGDFTSHDVVTFDSSLGSPFTDATVSCGAKTVTGGLKFNFLATGNTTFTAHFDVVGGSGALAGTTGSGTMTGVPGYDSGTGTYVMTLHLR
jgi:hypothetical protein